MNMFEDGVKKKSQWLGTMSNYFNLFGELVKNYSSKQ